MSSEQRLIPSLAGMGLVGIIRLAVVLLGLVAIATLFVELWKCDQLEMLAAVKHHDFEGIAGRFYGFIAILGMCVLLSLAGLVFGAAAWSMLAVQSGQGYLIFLVLLGLATVLSLTIYLAKLGGTNQENFGLAGTGGLAFLFGFLQGFNMKRGDRS